MSSYQYYNNLLCVPSSWLYGEAGIISYDNYKNLINRNHLEVLRRGGNGRVALVALESMRSDIKAKVIEILGDPNNQESRNLLMDDLVWDMQAEAFYQKYKRPCGNHLPEDIIKQYTVTASILKAVIKLMDDTQKRRRSMGLRAMNLWSNMVEVLKGIDTNTWFHKLPANGRRLRDRVLLFQKEGYKSIIHKNFSNQHSEKLSEAARAWILSSWANAAYKIPTLTQLHTAYNAHAQEAGWALIKSEKTLYNFLYSPEVKAFWWGHRYGMLSVKEKFALHHKTRLPSMRDSLWYGDGTKLNFFYLDENGNMATCMVYEVMDAFSEVFLGYGVGKTESHASQYDAYRMAIEFAQHRPYEIRFDSQGGHKKLIKGDFLSKITHLPILTAPYNGKSKTIESAFGRFQRQILAKHWFFTGQNITAKCLESRANMEFILANKKKLPSLKEALEAYKKSRLEWNKAAHPNTGLPRLQLYKESVNPKTPKIGLLDMVNYFWILKDKSIKLSASGLHFELNKQAYDYMAYTDNKTPDVAWLQKNIDRRFWVKYDPKDMDMIYLYVKEPSGGLRFERELYTKLVIHRAIQDQNDFDREYIQTVRELNKKALIETKDAMDDILLEHHMHPEQYGLVNPRIPGVDKTKKKRKKVAKEKETSKEVDSVGIYQKEISNLTFSDEIDIYKRL